MHEPRFRLAPLRPGTRIEQPILQLDLGRDRVVRIHPQFRPQLLDGTPVALQPAAVLVGAVALGFPLRAGREELGVVGHVELGART